MSETFDMGKTKIGTPFVMAPEIWEGKKYNQKSDIWSLGCVLYKMLTFRYPFQAESKPILILDSGALMMKVLTQKVAPVQEAYSQDLKGLLNEMLQK